MRIFVLFCTNEGGRGWGGKFVRMQTQKYHYPPLTDTNLSSIISIEVHMWCGHTITCMFSKNFSCMCFMCVNMWTLLNLVQRMNCFFFENRQEWIVRVGKSKWSFLLFLKLSLRCYGIICIERQDYIDGICCHLCLIFPNFFMPTVSGITLFLLFFRLEGILNFGLGMVTTIACLKGTRRYVIKGSCFSAW